MASLEDLERRVARLEKLVGSTEVSTSASSLTKVSDVPSPVPAPHPEPATALIALNVFNKRYQGENHMAGIYQEAIWFDCVLTLHEAARATRAVKGTLEFCDLFGDVQFMIGYTVNETLSPSVNFTARGIGFDYNQFMPDHQWMLVTDLQNMVVRFRVHQVMYVDGSSERL